MIVLKRLFRYLSPYWHMLVASTLLLLAVSLLQLVPPLFQRAIVDEVIGNKDLTRLGIFIGGLVGVLAAQHLANAGDLYIRHALGQHFIFDLRVGLYAYLQRLSLSFFERTSTGELMSRVTNDVNALEHFVTHGSAFAGVALLRLFGAGIVLFVLDWQLALAVLAPLPILAVALRLFNTRIRPIYRKVRDRLGDINAQLQDSLSGIQVIQAFGQEDRELERFSNESRNYYETRVRGIRYWSTFFPSMRFVASMGTVIVLGVGALKVVQGNLSLGTFVAFLSYIISFYEPVHRLTDIDNVLQEAIAAAERIFELLDASCDIEDGSQARTLDHVQGQISLEDVSFSYDTGDEVLRNVSFEMEPGEVVALVGPSGAGKTSIANLISRFYDPTAGRITLDGQDLRDITLASLRGSIAVVLQDTFLFNTTVKENLLHGKPDATDEELGAAAQAAWAHDFIMALPEGYDTEIGERGVKLSGGQKQRLALTRAILADPRILILDEATSSVDAEAEFLIQQALDAVLKGRTALVIAHRLSTIRNADKIIALEEGRIIEVGDHRELMKESGLYSRLYKRQLELTSPGLV